ncbi:2-oxoglutarate-dependent dioxygenase 19 [Sesamum alatum]|uniref:2-oxoglutarate-dependent dioxygenase 19 n=1 Tax=Sesamum alatum TaxID=300844 RepID=A0AAE2CXF6_9LAMI|nr:2-oxoglutarate-dependent dioxygenase 19 [Sesamum alatum]
MAETAPLLGQHSTASITCVKKLAESTDLNSIPSYYAYYTNPAETMASDPMIQSPPSISRCSPPTTPIIGPKPSTTWTKPVINHGIPEELMRAVIDVTNEFFNLPEEEKPEFQPENVLEPIRYGTSFNTAKEKVFSWRDFLKVFVHPEFHCPDKPQPLREVLMEYCERSRQVVRKLLKGISQSLGIEETEMEKSLGLNSSLQIFIANLYPRCPDPDTAVGIAPHSDQGLLTLLIQNQVAGLQLQHKGNWVNVTALPNSIMVVIGDHLEIFSNGKYKSVLHRAMVNNEKTRISIAMFNGPSVDTVVSPAARLLRTQAPAYVPMKYKDYLMAQQSNQLYAKSILKRVRIQN